MADDDEFEGNKKDGSKKLLIIIVALVVLAGGGAGAWFFLLAGEPEPVAEVDGEPATPPLGPVQYLNLAPAFIVNFPHQGRQRFLQADITVMGRDAQGIAAVSQHMPAIRHALNNLFAVQLVLVFEDQSGIERLRQLATDEVNQVLIREIGRPGIDEVLFTSFVMQ